MNRAGSTRTTACLLALAFVLAGACEGKFDSGDPADQSGSTTDFDTSGPLLEDDAVAPAKDVKPPPTPGNVPSYDDDQAILDYCEAVLMQCPPLSQSTVPAGWDMLMVTESGCTVHAPPGWLHGVDGVTFEVTKDAAGTAGYFVLATYVPGTDWNEATLADYLYQELLNDYPDMKILKAETFTDSFGLGLKIRVVSVKFTQGGLPTVGVLRVVHYECSMILGNCPLTSTGVWVPLAEVASLSCTLAQIDASLRCPSGGGSDCSEGECDTYCKSQGYSSGSCVGDDCQCG